MLPQKPTLKQAVLERRHAWEAAGLQRIADEAALIMAGGEREAAVSKLVLAALPVEIDPALIQCEEEHWRADAETAQYSVTIFPTGETVSRDDEGASSYLYKQINVRMNDQVIIGELTTCWFCRSRTFGDEYTDLLEGLARCMAGMDIQSPPTPVDKLTDQLAGLLELLDEVGTRVNNAHDYEVDTRFCIHAHELGVVMRDRLVEAAQRLGFEAHRWGQHVKGGWWDKTTGDLTCFTIHDSRMTDEDAGRLREGVADERAA